MWVFLNNAFLSIVQHRDDPDKLMVRARRSEDIRAIWPSIKIEITSSADYPARVTVPRRWVMNALSYAVEMISYPNFKGSIIEDDRHDAYFAVWSAMRRLFDERNARDDDDLSPDLFDLPPVTVYEDEDGHP